MDPIELRRLAVVGIDVEIARLELVKQELLAEPLVSPSTEPVPRKRRTMSAAARRKISLRMKKRWAAHRGE